MLIFVTGGVRSGKSSFAEQLAVEMKPERLYYLATSIPYDREMEGRVAHHRESRELSRVEWITLEEPYHFSHLIPLVQKDDLVLLDCLTTLLSNRLFVGWESEEKRYEEEDFRQQLTHSLLEEIRGFTKRGTLIIVSNEVNHEPVSRDMGTFYYTKLLGELHQRIVEEADVAYLVEFGIRRKMKG